MKIGLQIPRFHWPGGPNNMGTKLAEIARTADSSGFYSLWVMDHFFQIGGAYGEIDFPMLEAYTALSYMAGVTKNVKLGAMITSSMYRSPGYLIKTVTSLDVLSGGRAILGIGAGWYDREARALGLPVPASLRERTGRFKETVRIAKHMWSDNQAPFVGKYNHLEEPICSPQPISKPHPPIIIAGQGEKVMLKWAARYGDGWTWHHGTHPKVKGHGQGSYDRYNTRFERIGHLLDVLKKHCEREKRDFEELEISLLCPIELSESAMTPEDVIQICEEMAGLGVHHMVFNMENDHEITPIETIGKEVLPKIRDL